jgi:hypothetical protein
MPRGATQRVKASRRLRQTGAVAVRPGVYAIPDSHAGRTALADAAREVARQRGAARRCLLTWLDSRDEMELRARYEKERSRRGQRLLEHIVDLERSLSPGSRLNAASRRTGSARLARLRKHLDRVSQAASPIAAPRPHDGGAPSPSDAASYNGRIWITRQGVLIDRIASAWLILRFIDHHARFQFVSPAERLPDDSLRFDMADAEFGHEGDRCTFETLAARFAPRDAALRHIAEIVHDLDINDTKFGRAEAPGVAQVIAGLTAAVRDDAARIQQGLWLFDCLHASLRPRPSPRLPKGVLP